MLAINLLSRLSDVAPKNLSRFGPYSSNVVANLSHLAASPNLVCLSDDELPDKWIDTIIVRDL